MLLSTPKSIGNRRTINLSQFDFWFLIFSILVYMSFCKRFSSRRKDWVKNTQNSKKNPFIRNQSIRNIQIKNIKTLQRK